jgi:hypothetical protein
MSSTQHASCSEATLGDLLGLMLASAWDVLFNLLAQTLVIASHTSTTHTSANTSAKASACACTSVAETCVADTCTLTSRVACGGLVNAVLFSAWDVSLGLLYVGVCRGGAVGGLVLVSAWDVLLHTLTNTGTLAIMSASGTSRGACR